MKKFFQRLLCEHVYNKPIISTDCSVKVRCQKCGKEEITQCHEYKEIKRYYSSKERDGGLYSDSVTDNRLHKIYECVKCGDIQAREWRV